MHIGIIGASDVAQTLAIGLKKHHQIYISSRQPDKYQDFKHAHPEVHIRTFQEAAAFGDIVINAVAGASTIETLSKLKNELKNKILIDVANPLDFSKPSFELFIANSDSLGEHVQRILPDTYVVKALNSVSASLMIQPSLLDHPHDLFICGNDKHAKDTVIQILKNDFGWQIIHDLGNIEGSRAMEQLLHLWLILWQQIGHTKFNFHIEIK
jgi:8-hydroxy-5-deazaflavin:NADPH oxidoreductase